MDSSGRLPKIVLPECDTLNLFIGRETWVKEELLTSVEETEADSEEYIQPQEPDTNSDDTATVEGHTSAPTESMIAKLLNLNTIE